MQFLNVLVIPKLTQVKYLWNELCLKLTQSKTKEQEIIWNRVKKLNYSDKKHFYWQLSANQSDGNVRPQN